MARTPPVSRDAVPEDKRAAFDAIVQERGGVPTEGPGSVLINAPDTAQRALGLALFLRSETSLEPRIRELAMLLAARENNCQFIWNAHASYGRQAGLRDEVVDALRDRKELPSPAADEAAVVEYGQQLFRTRRVSKEAFDAVVGHFGVAGTTELTTLLGCYTMLAFNINAFEVELPAGRTEEPLPV